MSWALEEGRVEVGIKDEVSIVTSRSLGFQSLGEHCYIQISRI